MKKVLLFGFLALGLGFTACDNDDDDTPAVTQPTPPTKTELITAKPWKLTGLTLNGTDVLNNPASPIPACNKDDLYKFNADSTLVVQDGTVKCQNSPSNGTWEFKNNETTLNLVIPSLGSIAGDFELSSLTATSMLLKRTQSSFTYEATFTAQ